jgi:hypothetical protein
LSLKFKIIEFFVIYYDIFTWVVKIIQVVAYDNYDDFQHVDTLFSQKFIFTILRII